MKSEGMISGLIGILLCLYAGFFQKTAVNGGFGEREVFNVGLQQDRLLLFAFGLTLLIMGTVLIAAANLQESLTKGTSPPVSIVENKSMPLEDEPISMEPKPAVEVPSIKDEMQHLGVSQQGDKYVFGAYRYDRLEDALAYARKQRP